jgi:hypothetical protein
MCYFPWAFPWLSPHILSKDPYTGPIVVELPPEVAKWITFEEQVTDININRLQEVVTSASTWPSLYWRQSSSEQLVSPLLDQRDT